jgi:hypothetical protein
MDAQEEFLTAFGVVRATKTPTALAMRGVPYPSDRKGRSEVHRLCLGRRRQAGPPNGTQLAQDVEIVGPLQGAHQKGGPKQWDKNRLIMEEVDTDLTGTAWEEG